MITLTLIENCLIRTSDRSYYPYCFCLSLFPTVFFLNVLLSLLFTLNWNLRDINTENFPPLLRSLELITIKLLHTEQKDEIIPTFYITTFSNFYLYFIVRALDSLINYSCI